MVKNWRKATQDEVFGTGARGYIDTSYSNLKSKLGDPTLRRSRYAGEHKTDAEWKLKFNDGTILRIYNYKDGKNYKGKKGKAKSNIKDWHVGGRGQVMKHLKELFPRAKSETYEVRTRRMYGKPHKLSKSVSSKAHFLDAHPGVLEEYQFKQRKEWERKINIARKESGLKPYDSKGWMEFYRDD